MRVTNSMLSKNYLYDLNNNLQNMQTIQQQMATGSLINKASDNPVAATKVMSLNNEIAQNTQYNTNISDTTNWLNVTDTSLGQATNVLQRVRELLVSSGNASYGPDEKQSIKDEINTNIGQLSQILNTSYDGKYIFGGTRGTDKPTTTGTDANGNTTLSYVDKGGTTAIPALAGSPTTAESNQINMINSPLSVEISQGVTVNYNITAGDLMEFKNQSDATNPLGTAMDLSTTLSNIVTDLGSTGTAANLTGIDLSQITDAITNVSNIRTKVGAMENRMSSAQTENEAESSNLTEILSKTNDVDFAQASMQYSTAQTAYQASLQVSAKILPETIMDYLK